MSDYDRNESFSSGVYSGSPAASYNFVMRIEGVYNVPLRSIRSFSKKNSYETIQEGGLNDYVHIKRKQNTEIFQMQVERYVSAHVLDPFANGAVLTLPVILCVYKGSIDDDHICRTYIFTGCEVMGKEYGELNAEKAGLATEVITLSFQEMFTIPNYADLGGDNVNHKDTVPLEKREKRPKKNGTPKTHGLTITKPAKRSAKKKEVTTKEREKRVANKEQLKPKLHGKKVKVPAQARVKRVANKAQLKPKTQGYTIKKPEKRVANKMQLKPKTHTK